MGVKRSRRLRRLRPDGLLLQRRAAGFTLRELAPIYGVSHTTLSRYFARPEVRRELRRAERALGQEWADRMLRLRRRLRRLEPDPLLLRQRAAGWTLRELAPDYGVSHTTLGRYLARPEVRRQLRRAERLNRVERRAQEKRWRAEEQADRAAATRARRVERAEPEAPRRGRQAQVQAERAQTQPAAEREPQPELQAERAQTQPAAEREPQPERGKVLGIFHF